MSPATRVEIEGRQLSLSNLDKVLYPRAGFTKGQVIAYYRRIAPVLLPHLSNRPLTLKRYPDGVEAQHFYEKMCPSHRPPWVNVAPVWSRHNRRTIEFCLADDVASVVWVANLASIELHTSLSCASQVSRPTMVVFDLDPGPPADVVDCARVAIWLREVLDHLGLAAWAKTSGSKGLQLYVPLNTPVTYDQTKPFAYALAQLLERRHPAHVVSNMSKELRRGKVLIDWSQNDEHKTTVCVYSLRARERPTVSAPLTWDEVEHLADDADVGAVEFEADAVVDRAEELGDLFAPVVQLQQHLPQLG